MKDNSKNNIYFLGEKLGLKYSEIDGIITNNEPEKVYYSMGPYRYPGTHYGTISIKEIL